MVGMGVAVAVVVIVGVAVAVGVRVTRSVGWRGCRRTPHYVPLCGV